MLIISLVRGQFGACEKRGDDTPCERFGPEYCCAYVDIKSDTDELKGYWCSNKEYVGPHYSFAGY